MMPTSPDRPRGGPYPSWLRSLLVPAVVLVLAGSLVRNIWGVAETAAGALALMAVAGLVALACARARSRPVRFALTMGAVLLASGLSAGVDDRVLFHHRSFFGVIRVTEDDSSRLRRLFHGSTVHGQQSLEPDRRQVPLSYYHPTGPIGQVFNVFQKKVVAGKVAIIGLGAGSLAAYAQPDQRWTFYEIDPTVERIARNPAFFSYLADSRALSIATVLGDARLSLNTAPDAAYDLIVLDAFSSDALPIHLLTREALALYHRKLAPGGLIAMNLSNRYLDLERVVGALAADAGQACRVRLELDVDDELLKRGKLPSLWGVVASDESDLGPLADDPAWHPPERMPENSVWTDNWSSLRSAWRTRGLSRASD